MRWTQKHTVDRAPAAAPRKSRTLRFGLFAAALFTASAAAEPCPADHSCLWRGPAATLDIFVVPACGGGQAYPLNWFARSAVNLGGNTLYGFDDDLNDDKPVLALKVGRGIADMGGDGDGLRVSYVYVPC